jgi:N-acetylneuraminic acid mutarotase
MYAQGTLPGGALTSTEIFDPETQRWTRAGSMKQARYCHTASLLPDGRVLVTGGFNEKGSGEITASAEIYDPRKDEWQPTADLPVALVNHAATVLPGGDVLITGGKLSMSKDSDGTLRYEVKRKVWIGMSNFTVSTNGHAAVLLGDDSVLVIGGANENGAIATVQVLPPLGDGWQLTSTMNTTRYLMTATRLPDGRVLVAGGGYATGSPEFVTAETEVYGPAVPAPAPEVKMPVQQQPAPHSDRLQDPQMD